MKNHLPLYLILLLSMTALASCNIDGESYDYYTEAFEIYGEYNGAIGVQGEHNYYIYLTNSPEGNEYPGPGTAYYFFDIFSTPGVPDRDGEIPLPSGTYTLGARGATAIGTFTQDYSYYIGSDRYGDPIEMRFSNGILRIDGDDFGYYEIEAELTDMAGMTHYVHYVGRVDIIDRSQGVVGGYQQLAQDLNIQAHAANATLYDDMEGLPGGISNVILSFTDMALDAEGYAIPPGSILNIDCYMKLTDEGRIPAGTYDISPEWGQQDFTLSPGEVINDMIVGTVVENYDSDENAFMGFITEGSLYIMNSTGLEYNIMYVFHTDRGYEITGNYNGPLDLNRASMTAARTDSHGLHRPVPSPLARPHYKVRSR